MILSTITLSSINLGSSAKFRSTSAQDCWICRDPWNKDWCGKYEGIEATGKISSVLLYLNVKVAHSYFMFSFFFPCTNFLRKLSQRRTWEQKLKK